MSSVTGGNFKLKAVATLGMAIRPSAIINEMTDWLCKNLYSAL